ncbi:hypothetical protein WDK64_07260 [Escherichia coli]
MSDEIQQLVKQMQILEQAAADKMSGTEKSALFKRAAEIKMQIIKLLPQQDKAESKIPDLSYFDNKIDPAFGGYFSGDYLDDAMREYFTVHVPENAPSARQSIETNKPTGMDPLVRKRILNAIGVPC